MTFVLPGRGAAGGIRVTVDLANELINRGHVVRVACRRDSSLTRRACTWVERMVLRALGGTLDDWVTNCRAEVMMFQRLSDLSFTKGEVAIAVGSSTVSEVIKLGAGVIKVRYCHGLQRDNPSLMHRAWSPPMPTLAVCGALVPDLLAYRGATRARVVHNGIHQSEYYDEGIFRDGIGAIFCNTYAKDPDSTLATLASLRESIPQARQYVFGPRPRPRGLPRESYWLLPSVAMARRLYNRCRIWILMSRTEGFPAPILEAMLCGCVVVSTEHDGSRELIRDGENGFRVPVGNVQACTARVMEVWHDPVLQSRIARAGLASALEFTWTRAAERFEMAIEEVLLRGELEDCS